MKLRSLVLSRVRQILCVILSFAMATGPSATVVAQTNAAAQAVRQRVEGLDGGAPAEQPAPQPTRNEHREAPSLPPSPVGDNVDTSYVSPNAVAIVTLRPAQLLATPTAQMLPVEVATAAGLKYAGFDPADVEQVVAFVDMPSREAGQFGYAVAIKFLKPFRGSAIPAERRAHAAPGDLAGRKYLQSRDPSDPTKPSFYAPDSKTLVVAPDTTLRQLVEAKDQPKAGPAIDRLLAKPPGDDLYVAVDVASLRPMILMGLMGFAQNLPPESAPFLESPNLISAAELSINISDASPIELKVHANDDASAEKLESLVGQALALYQEHAAAQYAAPSVTQDPLEQAMAKYMERMSGQMAANLKPQREGASLTFLRNDGQDPSQAKLTQMAAVGMILAASLPATQAARASSRRSNSTNNMKQIVLALHNYHDAKKMFPAHASYGPDGQPLLSWRVHILPFIDQMPLYKKFKLDEPWDSEHNRALIAQMPPVYANPELPLEPGKTDYLAVVGESCGFDGTKTGMAIKKITDGTSNTVVVVEANPDQAVEWTKPDDLEFDASNPTAGLGGLRPGGWNAAFADGSVQLISPKIDPEIVKGLFTRNGGEVTNAR